MEGVLVVGQQNAEIADTLPLREVTIAITFDFQWGYK